LREKRADFVPVRGIGAGGSGAGAAMPVLIVKKDDSAVIAALRDMMWIFGSDDASDFRHGERLALNNGDWQL